LESELYKRSVTDDARWKYFYYRTSLKAYVSEEK